MPVFLQEESAEGAVRAVMYFASGYWWITSASGGAADSLPGSYWIARGAGSAEGDVALAPGAYACDFDNVHWCFPATTGGRANAFVHVDSHSAVVESCMAELSVRLAELTLRFEESQRLLKVRDATILSLEGSRQWTNYQPSGSGSWTAGQAAGSGSGASQQASSASQQAWEYWTPRAEKEVKSGWLNKCVALLYAVEIHDTKRLTYLLKLSIGCI